MIQKKKEKATKVKKKHWYPILAPKMFRNALLGETLLTEANLAVKKPITKNLANLIGDMKKQNINITFVVDKIDANKAYTTVRGYHIVPSSLKRLTRRRSDKIELSFICETSDNKKVRIKPLIFTRSLTKSSITNLINKTTKEYLIKLISRLTFENLVNDLINNKLQSLLRGRIKRIYPLRNVQIKSMEIEKKKRPMEEKKVEQMAEEKKEDKEQEKPEENVKEKKEETKKEENKDNIEQPKKTEEKPEEEVPKEEPKIEEKKPEEKPEEEKAQSKEEKEQP